MSYCHVKDAVAVDEYGIRYYVDVDESTSLYLVWADGPGCHLGTLNQNMHTEQEAMEWIDKEVAIMNKQFKEDLNLQWLLL